MIVNLNKLDKKFYIQKLNLNGKKLLRHFVNYYLFLITV